MLRRGESRPWVVWYHPGLTGGIGGIEEAAHSADHHKIAVTWICRLQRMTEGEKERMRPALLFDQSNLAATASVTQGDVSEHVHIAVSMINKWLPPNLRFGEEEILP